nr:ABC transporter permease [uncultured Oscillibacter sp.]
MKDRQHNVKRQNRRQAVVTSAFALIFSLLLGAVLLAICGYSPIESYTAIFGYSLGTLKGFALTLSQATPILFTGMAFAIAYRVRMINTGAEGQLYAGAMASALAGAYIVGLPSVIHVPICLLAAALAGGLLAAFVAFLKIKFGASEIILTLLLNDVLILITGYLANGPLRRAGSSVAQTEKIQDSAQLIHLIPQTQLTIAFLIGVVLAIVLQFILTRTKFGFEVQVTGYNLKAARTAGIPVSRTYLLTFAISGAVAALGGAAMVLGVNYRFLDGFSASYGFGGISVAALAAYSPLGVILSSFLIGILKAGAITLNRTTSIPVEFVSVIQVMVIIFVAAPKLIHSILKAPKKGLKRLTGKAVQRKEAV